MNMECVVKHHQKIAVITSQTPLLKTPADALELLMAARYEAGAQRLALSAQAIEEDFFWLSTGLAGEVLEKFVTYRCKLGIFGDLSRFTLKSPSLRDFIYESNQGRTVCFLLTREETVTWLASR